ncbi:hypothetical protein K474DRAFT_1608630 [Panus rudis PR-1116 ss-1]|nr:hypothetical protein K474DRAFT_1608630 [Panus rudis PR-1116 ss-1]
MEDFLARESEVLGDEFSTPTATGGTFATASGGSGVDDFDFDRVASAFPDISLDGSSDIPSIPQAPPLANVNSSGGGSTFSFEELEPSGGAPREVRVTGDEEIEKFESEFPEIEVPQPSFTSPPVSQPSFGTSSTTPFAPKPQSSAFTTTPLLSQPVDEEEPEPVKQWREKQAAEIKARDEASAKKREEIISKAERAIDQFYEEYAAKKEKNIRENKEHEEEFVQKMTDSLSQGTTWERIADIIELQNSQSKTIARAGAGTTDLARFREVLLRLKREGESAPGAAGY